MTDSLDADASRAQYLVLKLPANVNERKLYEALSEQGLSDVSFVRELWASRFFNSSNKPPSKEDARPLMYVIPPAGDEETAPGPSDHGEPEADVDMETNESESIPDNGGSEYAETPTPPRSATLGAKPQWKASDNPAIFTNWNNRSQVPDVETKKQSHSNTQTGHSSISRRRSAKKKHDDVEDTAEMKDGEDEEAYDTADADYRVGMDEDGNEHHPNRPYKLYIECALCGSSLKTHNTFNLTDHMRRRHSDLKQYGCTECGYEACKRAQVLKHINRDHLGKGEPLDNKTLEMEEEWKHLMKECFPDFVRAYRGKYPQETPETKNEWKIRLGSSSMRNKLKRKHEESMRNEEHEMDTTSNTECSVLKNLLGKESSPSASEHDSPAAAADEESFEIRDEQYDSQPMSSTALALALTAPPNSPARRIEAPLADNNIFIKQEVMDPEDEPYPSNDFLNTSFHDGAGTSDEEKERDHELNNSHIILPRKKETQPTHNRLDSTTEYGVEKSIPKEDDEHATCRLCQAELVATRPWCLWHHVQCCHIAKYFSCPVDDCTYTSVVKQTVINHISQLHKDYYDNPIVHFNKGIEDEEQMVMKQCFPEYTLSQAGGSYRSVWKSITRRGPVTKVKKERVKTVSIKCQVCSKTLNHIQLQYHKLFGHAQTHHTLKAFRCPMCPFAGYSATSARQHLRNYHKADRELVVDLRTPELLEEWRELAKKCFPSLADKAATFKFRDSDNIWAQATQPSESLESFDSYSEEKEIIPEQTYHSPDKIGPDIPFDLASISMDKKILNLLNHSDD